MDLMYYMRRFHKFEYNLHFRKILLLCIATVSSLSILIVAEIWCLYTNICGRGMPGNETMEAFYDYYAPNPGICHFYYNTFLVIFFNENWLGLVIFVIDFMILIPSLTFFALDHPHDCFVCLGKDPKRVYSIHQMTTIDRTKRKMYARFSYKDSSKNERPSLVNLNFSEFTKSSKYGTEHGSEN